MALDDVESMNMSLQFILRKAWMSVQSFWAIHYQTELSACYTHFRQVNLMEWTDFLRSGPGQSNPPNVCQYISVVTIVVGQKFHPKSYVATVAEKKKKIGKLDDLCFLMWSYSNCNKIMAIQSYSYLTVPEVFRRTEAAKLWVTPTKLVPSTSTIKSFTWILGEAVKRQV